MDLPDDTHLLRTVYGAAPARTAPHGERLPVVVVMRGAQVGRRYLLNEAGLVLGRRADKAQLVVPGDGRISSAHCRFERAPESGQWQVVDLQSTNGTLVENHRIETWPLRDGDRLFVGETVLKFTFHDEIEDEFYRRVDYLMNADDLTGLPVQRVYQARLQEQLATARRTRQPVAVYMMDMDGLKRMNDTHGHFVGAHAIATVGKRLGALLAPEGGVVSRFGGDEFSAFVPNASRERAHELGERMRKAVVDAPIAGPTATVNPSISIGLAVWPDDGDAAEQVTRQADEALYRAKAAGRNCVCE
jgi:diguanylate cyclase (GGDEF)-like protein